MGNKGMCCNNQEENYNIIYEKRMLPKNQKSNVLYYDTNV